MTGHSRSLMTVTRPNGQIQNQGVILGAWVLRDGTTVNVVEGEDGTRRICVTTGSESGTQLLMARAVTIGEALCLAELQLSHRRSPFSVNETSTVSAAALFVLAIPDARACLEGPTQ